MRAKERAIENINTAGGVVAEMEDRDPQERQRKLVRWKESQKKVVLEKNAKRDIWKVFNK